MTSDDQRPRGVARSGESLRDAAIRCATDAVYEARNTGGSMHTAGEWAALAVLDLLPREGRVVGVTERPGLVIDLEGVEA